MAGRRRRRKPLSQTGVTLRLAGLTLGVWLIGMICATIGLAEAIGRDSYEGHLEFADYIYRYGWLEDVYERADGRQDYVAYSLYAALAGANSHSYYFNESSDTGLSVLRHERHTVQTAGLVLRPDGTVFAETGDFIYFRYQTEASWDQGLEETHIDGYARVRFDRDKLTEAGREQIFTSGLLEPALRLTGRLDGTEFIASKIEFIDYWDFQNALHSTEPTAQSVDEDGNVSTYYKYIYSDIVRLTDLAWQTMLDDPSRASDEDIVLYADRSCFASYEPTDPVKFGGQTYDSLMSLLYAYAEDNGPGEQNYYRSDSLFNQIVVEDYYIHEEIDATWVTSEPQYVHRYTLLVATQFSPMKAAVVELRNVYIWTFLLTLALFYYARKAIRRDIVYPVERIGDGMADGFRYLGAPDSWPQRYRDTELLCEQYDMTRVKLAMQRDEIQRLQTALTYAEQAERNRREMTSHIAHELKTPLAVLHTYAEGLSERIAEDKRDHYLAVIQGEVERMDAMVLEMLDLSRLEAGRVTLVREDFSLPELVTEIWTRFEKTAADRALQVSFALSEPCVVSADRARIEQVATNFLSNAVRYTPEGGQVKISVRAFRGRATFAIENDAEPLSPEALSKVFDSFYRADESRSSPGTGLGLAISKSIIELHGGSCTVRNTDRGVEFRFVI